MRVAITGANGFTGRFVVAALAEAGVDTVALRADLTDAAAVFEEVSTVVFDRVVHLAGAAFAGGSDWHVFYAVNQLGTFNLLDAVARAAPGARCVIASSAQVYGAGASGLIGEHLPTQPSNHYAVSKRAMELGAELWRDRLQLVITRPFNYTGVGQDVQYLIPKIVDHFRRSLPVIELGNTWVKRDFGDVRSVAQAYSGLIMAEKPPALVNIATGTTWSIDDIINRLSAMSGHALEVKINKAFVRSGDVPVLGGDDTYLRAALPQWRPYSLEDTLKWMYNY
ncbi:GDP-mannose 4,6-dehydratase [Sphingomonas sp. HHU CXW]|uniref:GDP-mannose 4,6-dehydratase n=1 Tax=Sphingomonas hominis TaxID=2741495 RepID=A0ABX2JSM0_9SPHN|nr:GDP-mannose 4,6-dehydratase [Sphingomonas hominis]NTS66808.1 GDP-mannose 4,6-dehydratase [Sphingomonas hominis]